MVRVWLCIALGGCVVGGEFGSQQLPIVDGVIETGRPGVVFLYNIAGSACTASLVAPRVALTAKHCVQGGANSAAPARNFRVLVGANTSRVERQYLVEEVRPAPGRWDLADASDVAVLILAQSAQEPLLEMSFDSPRALIGQTFTAVGYGQTPSGASGQKLVTQKRVDGTRNGFIWVQPSVCQGDSGGPLIGPEGKIWGVASFIVSLTGGEPRCGSARGAYNMIQNYQSFIETAIEDSGSCVPREEVCNSVDDNCDGVVDEGCTPLGAACNDDSECTGELCDLVGEARICTQRCDPLRAELGCPPGMYCQFTEGCGGLCAAGAAGAGLIEDECVADTDCITAFCADPGDGRRRCLAPCRGDEGMCLAGEVCAAAPGSCGGCVERSLVRGARGIGEPCDADAECGSGLCFEDEGVRYCSRQCSAEESSCGDAFHCRVDEMGGICVRGPLEAVGGGCVVNSDCGSGICATRGDTRFCTAFCDTADQCPDRFMCGAVGEETVCLPDGSLVGEACTNNEECASGLCASGTSEGSICTRLCGAMQACSPGFECLRLQGGTTAVCVPSERRESDGGCSAASTGRSPIGLMGLVLVMLGLSRRRVYTARRAIGAKALSATDRR